MNPNLYQQKITKGKIRYSNSSSNNYFKTERPSTNTGQYKTIYVQNIDKNSNNYTSYPTTNVYRPQPSNIIYNKRQMQSERHFPHAKSVNISQSRSTTKFNLKNLKNDENLKASKNLLPNMNKGEATTKIIRSSSQHKHLFERPSYTKVTHDPNPLKTTFNYRKEGQDYKADSDYGFQTKVEEYKGNDKVIQSKLESLENEVKELQFSLEVFKKKSNSQKIKDLCNQIVRLNKRIQELEEENSKLKNLADDELVIVEKIETKEVYGKKGKNPPQLIKEETVVIQEKDQSPQIRMIQQENSRLVQQVQNLRQQYNQLLTQQAKGPKIIKIETVKKMDTKIEPGDVTRLMKEERQKNVNLQRQNDDLKRQLKNLEEMNNMKTTQGNLFNNLQNELRNKERVIENYKKEIIERSNNPELLKELEHTRNMLTTIRTQSTILKSKNEDQRRQIDQLDKMKNDYNFLKRDLLSKNNDLQSLQKDMQLKETLLNQKSKQVDERNRTIEELTNQLRLKGNKGDSNNDLKLQSLKQIQDHQKSLLEEKNFVISQYKDKVNIYQKDLDRLREELKMLRDDREEFANRKNQSIQKQLNLKENELQSLDSNLSKLQRENKILKQKIDDIDSELQRLREYKKRNPEIRKLNSQEELVSLMNKLKANDDEMQYFKDKMEKMKNKLNNLKKSENNLRDENDKLSSKIRNLFEDKENLRELYNKSLKSNSNEKKELEFKLQELRNRNQLLQGQIDQLKLNNNNNPQPQGNIQKEYIKETIERQSNQEMEGLLKDIYYAIKDMNSQKQPTGSQKQITDLKNDLLPLLKTLGQKSDPNVNKNTLQEKIVSLYEKNAKLDADNQNMKEKLNKFENIIQNKNTELREIREIHYPVETKSVSDPNQDIIFKLQRENDALKKGKEDILIKYNKLNDDLIKKKRALLVELSNFVNSKNTFENSFYSELTKSSNQL